MPLVGTLLGDDIYQSGAIAAEFRREVIRGDAHFLHVFGVRIDVSDSAALGRIDGRRIDKEAVGFGPRTVGVKIDTVFRVKYVSAGLRIGLAAAACYAAYTWRDRHQ